MWYSSPFAVPIASKEGIVNLRPRSPLGRKSDWDPLENGSWAVLRELEKPYYYYYSG